jgi:hypothetical protein
MIEELKKLRKNLRTKATYERKRIGDDKSHYEGMKKGLWLAFEEAANELDKLIPK